MTKYARIENNTVLEIIDFDPTGKFHPMLLWVPCSDDTKEHDTYNDGVFVPRVEPVVQTPEEVRAALLANATPEELAAIEAATQYVDAEAAKITGGSV